MGDSVGSGRFKYNQSESFIMGSTGVFSLAILGLWNKFETARIV